MVIDYLKLINVQQANITHAHKNMKEKLHRTNASIYFNKMCTSNHLTPNYIKITNNGHNKASSRTSVSFIFTANLNKRCYTPDPHNCQLSHFTLVSTFSLTAPVVWNPEMIPTPFFLKKCKTGDLKTHSLSSSSSSSSSSYICHGVGPLVVLFRSHVSRSLFKGLP